MFKRTILVSVAVLALALSATALAGNGYRVWGSAWHRPPTGSLFTVLSHGVAAQKAHVHVYLDRKPCRATWLGEATRFQTFQTGQSYFKKTGRAFVAMTVDGHFSKAFTARAGTTAEAEYACSYLTIPDSQGRYRATMATRSNEYFVTG